MPKIENLNEKKDTDTYFKNRPSWQKKEKFGKHKPSAYGAFLIALGIAVSGFFIGHYYYKSKTQANTVIVKGLSEMDVKADLAIWEMKYVVTGNDVVKAQQEISSQTKIISAFLKDNGFNENEITIGRLETNDLNANPYRSSYENNMRFILNQTITVRSENVDLIAQTLNKSGDLVAQGVIFNSEYGSPVSYLFTKINEIKPKMLADATQNAREAAAQFALSSQSKVGKIKHANQGVFSILPREQTSSATESQQIDKKVRVVSTIEYWLE